jgi:hypothetical protein
VLEVAMSNQRSFKIEIFRFAAFVPKNIFVFETKFWIETKRFLSVLDKFGPKAFVLVCFQIFLGQQKVLFCL